MVHSKVTGGIEMMQETFNPVDYGFEWVDDWYVLHPGARNQALVARNLRAKQLRGQGYTVRSFALNNQLITRGGIGTKHPQIELLVTVYGLNAWRKR